MRIGSKTEKKGSLKVMEEREKNKPRAGKREADVFIRTKIYKYKEFLCSVNVYRKGISSRKEQSAQLLCSISSGRSHHPSL